LTVFSHSLGQKLSFNRFLRKAALPKKQT